MEECISVFDMLKIGVGPSSSHNPGGVERFSEELRKKKSIQSVIRVKLILYSSYPRNNSIATD
jgi:L-serine dehydratase